ncbi:MAG: GNAT family N-acetyltransferase [Terriglobia bacterium]
MNYVIRPCRTRDELAACITLQKRIWGYSDLEVYPARLFVNLAQIGGHVLGAFTPAGEAVGFVASMPAWRNHEKYYHSLSLGVLPEHENRGLGRALKLEQRRLALRTGIERIEWTFDPLRAKNAFFNIVRLGAMCRRYIPDHYGAVDSRLQKGLPSDRLVAEWWLRSPRVRRALAGKPPRSLRGRHAAEITIPGNIEAMKRLGAKQARNLQTQVRDQFTKSFAQGLVVTGFVLEGRTAMYVLDAYED